MKTLDKLLQENFINEADYYFARHLFGSEAGGNLDNEIAPIASLISALNRQGHICIDLENLTQSGELADLLKDLDFSGIIRKHGEYIGEPGEFKPFIFDGKRLYLHKYFEYENFVADNLLKRSKLHYEISEECINAFANDNYNTTGEVNFQNLAVFMGLRNNLSFISGGPGTGKTTTVARILYYHTMQDDTINIALAAPTGKAAARIGDSLSESLKRFRICRDSLTGLQTMTIHRLLGYSPYLEGFKYSKSKTKKHDPALMEYDLIVIDEASMIDLSLMYHLLKALPLETKVVFLGDRRQLASVAPGAVFGDICDIDEINGFSEEFVNEYRRFSGEHIEYTATQSALRDNIVELIKSYRYKANSDIAKTAQMIEKGESRQLKEFLLNPDSEGPGSVRLIDHGKLTDYFNENLLQHFFEISNSDKPDEAYKQIFNCQILTPNKKGRFSTETINNYFIRSLREKLNISRLSSHFKGIPVLINKNDYINRLFNGDLGLIFGETPDQLNMYFPSQEENTFRKFRLKDIYGYDFAYCLTVHKSQGSEFYNIVLVLPEKNEFLTRELIYTAVTRARSSVVIIGSVETLIEAISVKTLRMSGLRDKIHF